MNPALWGGLSSLSFGTADFMARFTSRAIGVRSALLGVLVVGCIVMTGWVFVADVELIWSTAGWYWVVASGAATTIMTLLLYLGLARGPISLVAPIVASHPVLVVALAVVFGARPTLVEWLTMGLTIVGVIIVARATQDEASSRANHSKLELQMTTRIAIAAMIVYAVLVFTAQRAVPIYGEVQTLWMARLVSLGVLVSLMCFKRERPVLSLRILPLVFAQGLLDGLGYLTLFAGSGGPSAEIAAVVASTFGVVTVLLARVILREQINIVQWTGIVLIFGCVAVLSG